ncbi:copper resistance D family protein [Domibacillus tundrae]|uniref:copper resistance D family protein n=1 Tax=Domibacillus tundrae TaxID=1587527 RepID=UPI00339AA510
MAVLYVTETLLYSCFSFLMGAFILQLIPSHKKPSILIRERWLYVAIAGIAVFAFTPVAVLIMELSKGTDLASITQLVIFSFTIGKAWAFTFAVAVFFALYLFTFPVLADKRFVIGALIFTIVLIFSISWSSHAASLTEWTGFLYHSVHFTAVSIWIGILIAAGWFAKDHSNWLSFLKWFSPVAVICFSFTIISGFFMMAVIMDVRDYISSWSLNYGQSLLIKHLLLLPILLFAFINSFSIKKRLQKQKEFDPRPWMKAESIVLLFIFVTTAFLGQQEPPHASSGSDYSPLFAYFYNGNIAMPTQFGWSSRSLLFSITAVLFFALCLWSYTKKAVGITFILSMLLVFSVYMALITGLH